jgi:hypothetical protein
MLLAAFVSCKSWAVEVASELLHASHCQMQAYAGHRTARIRFQLPNTISQLSFETKSWGLTTVCALRKKYDTPASAVRLHHSTLWNMGEMTLEINLCEVTAPFECCILETEWMETWGNSLRFRNRKCIKCVKKFFHHQICYFLGRKFSYAGMY